MRATVQLEMQIRNLYCGENTSRYDEDLSAYLCVTDLAAERCAPPFPIAEESPQDFTGIWSS